MNNAPKAVEPEHRHDKAPKPQTTGPDVEGQDSDVRGEAASALRAFAQRRTITPAQVLALQRTIGNQAVMRLLAKQSHPHLIGVIQRNIGVGPQSPTGFKELVQFFLDLAEQVGGEPLQMIETFRKDKQTSLYFYSKPRPPNHDGTEGLTVPSIFVDGKWKATWQLEDKEWATLPTQVQLRIDIVIYYDGQGLNKDKSKHFYTLLHEFAVHAQPFFTAFNKIRAGQGPKTKSTAGKVGLGLGELHHHDAMALGQNEFYERMYDQTLDLLREMELGKKNMQGVRTQGLVDEHSTDKFTQKVGLYTKLTKAATEELNSVGLAYHQESTKANLQKVVESLRKHMLILAPVKKNLEEFANLFVLWPELVQVFPPQQQFVNSKATYEHLSPKVLQLKSNVTEYYEFLENRLLQYQSGLNSGVGSENQANTSLQAL